MNSKNSAVVADMVHGAASKSSSQADQSLYQSQSRSSSPISIPAKQTLSEEQRKTIKSSLNFKQRDARLLTLKEAQTKTCQWLLKNPKYVDWIHADKLHQHRGFFWIKGKPGSGKSIMMKFLFSRAKKSMRGSIVLSFFFNARGETLEKTTSGLYRALVLQLLEKAPQTWTAFEDDDNLDALLNLVEQSGWQDELLRQIFVRCLRKLENKRVVCYVDALDECPESSIREMISLFEEIGEMESIAEFRVCFSSRHYPQISIRTGLQLVLEEESQHTEDITLYIDAKLRIGNDPQLEDVKAEIVRKASGIFLWVHLVIPELNKEYDSGRIKALKKRLAQMPAGLHELFVDMLTRDQHRLEHFRLCVEVILHAVRPLKPKEFRIAVEAYSDSTHFDASHDRSSMDADHLRKFVLDSSKGLAEITKSDDPTVQWIHESVRDFFLKEDGMSKLKNTQSSSRDLKIDISGHSIFVELCFRQFHCAIISTMAIPSGPSIYFIFPFLSYALSTIFQHANEAHRANQDQASFHERFKACEGFWRSWNPFRPKYHHSGEEHIHLLYFLSECGADELIRLHPDKDSHLTLEDGPYGSPLLAALYANQTEAARALLGLPSSSGSAQSERISGPNHALKKDKFRKKRHILTYLCEYGDLDLLQHALSTALITTTTDVMDMFYLYKYAASEMVVDVLSVVSYALRNNGPPFRYSGAPVNFPGDNSDSNLHANLQHLRKLLKKYPDLKYDTSHWSTQDLLSYAASRGFHGITKLCIESSEAFYMEKAFVAAISGKINQRGRSEVIEQLLGAGLELNPDNDTVKEAMFNMILKPHNEDLVRLLLTKIEWYLEATYMDGFTLLLWALHQGRKTYFKIFLDAGANPMARPPIDGIPTALMLAVVVADLSSFRQLLQHPQYRLDAHDEGIRTASFWCSQVINRTRRRSRLAMLSQILEQPGMTGNLGRSLLSTAVELRRGDAVEIFLTYVGIKPDCVSGDNSTPLWKCLVGYVETNEDVYLRIARKLLYYGADFYCNRRPTTPANVILRHDSIIYAQLWEIWAVRAGGKRVDPREIPKP